MSKKDSVKKEALAELMRLSKANGGTITAVQTVEAARSPTSPMHYFFEWDDTVAAEKYRIEQAKTLIRACYVDETIHNEKVRAPYYVRDPELDPDKAGYVESGIVKTDRDYARDSLIAEFERAKAMLDRAQRLAKYFDLQIQLQQMIDQLVAMQGVLHPPPAVHQPRSQPRP